MGAFFGHNIAVGKEGGRRDKPKAGQEIVIRSRVLCNNYLQFLLFHTVQSSIVLHRRLQDTHCADPPLQSSSCP